MSSLIYLVTRTLKNRLLNLKNKPTLLLIYIFFIILFVIFIVTSMKNGKSYELSSVKQDITILECIYTGYILLFTYIGVNKGLTSGGSLFEMSDVNFIFVSPVRPSSILVYGIARQVGISLIAGIFILFQGSSLKSLFGIDFTGMLLLFLLYVFSIVVCEITSIAIYKFSSGNEKRKWLVKSIMIMTLFPLVFLMIKNQLSGLPFMTSLSSLFNSRVVYIIPIAGWVNKAAIGFIFGDLTQGFIFLSITICLAAIGILYITFSKDDYYEDVLCSTETNFIRKIAASDGSSINNNTTQRKVKVKGTGIIGYGAKVILGRHIRENIRENRLIILDNSSLFTIIFCSVFAYLSLGKFDIYIVLYMVMFMKILTVGVGKGLKDLYCHYIYLIPESSFSKLLWSNIEIIVKSAIESFIIFTLIGIFMKESLVSILICILTVSCFVMLLISINILSMRLFDRDMKSGLLLLLYFISVLIIMLPGILAAIITGIMVSSQMATALPYIILSAWEFIVALVIFYLSRGIIDSCDMATINK